MSQARFVPKLKLKEHIRKLGVQRTDVGGDVRLARERDSVNVRGGVVRELGVYRKQRVNSGNVNGDVLIPPLRNADAPKGAPLVRQRDEIHGFFARLVKAAPLRAAGP